MVKKDKGEIDVSQSQKIDNKLDKNFEGGKGNLW